MGTTQQGQQRLGIHHPPSRNRVDSTHLTLPHNTRTGMGRCWSWLLAAGALLSLVNAGAAAQSSQQQQQPQQQNVRAHLLKDTTARLYHHSVDRLAVILNNTQSASCAEEVSLAYEAFLTAHMTETLLPFESPFVKNQCPMPGRNTSAAQGGADEGGALAIPEIFKTAEDLRLLYVITAHRDLEQVVRLIEALQDDPEDRSTCPPSTTGTEKSCARSHFVVHVDGKLGPLPADLPLLAYASMTPNVYVMREGRVNVSWGGFSVVQATLNAISYGFYLKLLFDRVINLSGATYPLTTPRQIRATLAKHPVNEQLMFIDPTANVPNPRVWHYFVECDNQMHRIARFGLPRGVPLRTGSQWFVISRDFAHYLLTDEKFVGPYTAYAQHILIPDENFFATVLMSSPYCHHHYNANYLHLTFDVWEDEKGAAADQSKCLQPDPRICGRSPLLVGVEEIDTLLPSSLPPSIAKNSNNEAFLFARKFDSQASAAVLEEVDRRLALQRAWEREEAAVAAAEAEAAAAERGESTCNSSGSSSSSSSSSSSGGLAGGVGGGVGTTSVLREHGIALESIQW